VYEIIVTWWLIDGSFAHERFGAYPSAEICEAYLDAELSAITDRRWSDRRVDGLGGCFLKRAAGSRVRHVAEASQ